MQFGFSYVGLIYLAMLFIPNGIWAKNQPKGYADYAARENKILLAFERVGQFIVTPCALIFSDFNPHGWNFWLVVLGISFLMMVLYDIAWVRYFKSAKTMQDFYQKAKPCMEMVRKLEPNAPERWASALYRIYLNLNMGAEFDEIDKLLKAQKENKG